VSIAALLNPTYIAAGAPTPAAVAAPPNPQNGGAMSTNIIDGTPVRVVVICLAAAAGLTALRLGGFRFNVGVST
jgi:alpha/beta superfamily hydrolase